MHAGQETGALVSRAAPSLQGNKFMVEYADFFLLNFLKSVTLLGWQPLRKQPARGFAWVLGVSTAHEGGWAAPV